jgi:hypothetical protein
VNAWVVSITVLLTIILSLTLGIAMGYVAVTAILRAMGHRPQPTEPPAAAFKTAEISGD